MSPSRLETVSSFSFPTACQRACCFIHIWWMNEWVNPPVSFAEMVVFFWYKRLLYTHTHTHTQLGFPGGSGVTNPPANAGDTGLIPRAAEQLSPRATATEAHAPRAQALQREKSLQWEACPWQLESGPCLPQLEKSPCSNENLAQPKINKIKKNLNRYTIATWNTEFNLGHF